MAAYVSCILTVKGKVTVGEIIVSFLLTDSEEVKAL